MTEDNAVMDIIDRAISVRSVLKLDDFLNSVRTAQVPDNATLARLLMAHLDEFASSDAEKVCADLISRQANFKELLAELIRYSAPSMTAFSVFARVMHVVALGHPILSHIKGARLKHVTPAFSAQTIASGLSLRVPEDYIHYKDAVGLLVSIDNPAEWYSTVDSIKVRGHYLNLACRKDGSLFSDNTIVIRPAIFAIYSKQD